MELGNLSQLFNFDYKPDAGPHELSQPESKGTTQQQQQQHQQQQQTIETPASSETPDFQCAATIPEVVPEASHEMLSYVSPEVLSPNNELETMLKQIENDIKAKEQVMKRANEVKNWLRSMLRRVEATVDVAEKQLDKALNSQLNKAKTMMNAMNEKYEERDELVKSVSQVYQKIQAMCAITKH